MAALAELECRVQPYRLPVCKLLVPAPSGAMCQHGRVPLHCIAR